MEKEKLKTTRCRARQDLNIKSRGAFFNPLSLINRARNVDVLYAFTIQEIMSPHLVRHVGALRLCCLVFGTRRVLEFLWK